MRDAIAFLSTNNGNHNGNEETPGKTQITFCACLAGKILIIIIIIIKALFKTGRPISEVQEEDAGINQCSVSINYMIKKQ